MGVAREQKLVIKHTFLEYVCDEPDQMPSICQPSRPRSSTEPSLEGLQLDPIYEEVRDLFHGSDSSGSELDENCQRDLSCSNAKRILMPATPEVSPLRCPATHAMHLPKYESWKDSMPAAALAAPEYADFDFARTDRNVWPDQCSTQNVGDGWWVPMPFEAGMPGLAMYCHVDPEQYHTQYFGSDSILACEPFTDSTAAGADGAEKKMSSTTGVHSRENVLQSDGENVVQETRTSVMLKGVPETCTRSTMAQLLDAAGFFGRFNFLYLPMDFKRNRNLGYALINLVSPKEALRLSKYFEGFTCWNELGGSACTVTWCSPQQGLQAHIDRYRNSPVMHDSVPEEWRPLLLTHGVTVPFPPPTMKIKAPKLKVIPVH